MWQPRWGRVSDPSAASSGPDPKAPGYAGDIYPQQLGKEATGAAASRARVGEDAVRPHAARYGLDGVVACPFRLARGRPRLLTEAPSRRGPGSPRLAPSSTSHSTLAMMSSR